MKKANTVGEAAAGKPLLTTWQKIELITKIFYVLLMARLQQPDPLIKISILEILSSKY